MNQFAFNESDTVQTMRQNLDAFIVNMKKDKYNIILKFMNELFRKNNTSLCNFKNMSETQINLERFAKVLAKHKTTIVNKLKINIDENDEELFDTPTKVFILIKNMVKTVEYSLIRTEINKKLLYTIIDKPNKSTRALKNGK